MSRTWKIILIVVGVLLVLLVVAKKQGWVGTGSSDLQVDLGNVELRTIVETVTASGKIQPETEINISPEVSGEIIALPIKEGQNVEEGELLVKINPDLYESAITRTVASVNSSKSALAQARAQLVETEKIFKRNEKLYQDQVISAADFDASQRAYTVAQLSVDAAKYQLKSAEATLDEAQKNLKRTIIKAPQAGTISKLSVELGERVVGTAQMTGTEMLRLANLEVMEVLVEVNENDIVRVKMGDSALVEVDAYLDEEFVGVVTEIANSANTVGTSADQVTNFDVKIRILKSSYQHLIKDGRNPFRPGMTATVDIKTNKVMNVPAVPIQAVTTRTDTSSKAKSYKMRKKDDEEESDASQGEFEVVFMENNGKAKLVVVKTGVQDDEFIEITSGFKGDEEIIIGPYDVVSKKLKTGLRIEKTGNTRSKKTSNSESSESL